MKDRKLTDSLLFFFVLFVLALCYSALRFNLNIEYQEATWQQLYDLSAPVPFSLRMLVPLLSRPLVELGLSVKDAFIVWEVTFTFVASLMLYRLLECYTETRFAKLGSILLVLVLMPAYLLDFGWPVFYPSDTASIALLLSCLYLVVRERFIFALGLLFISTINRESSVLLVLVFAILFFDRLRLASYIKWLVAFVVVYCLARYITFVVTADNPLPYGSAMAFLKGDSWRIDNNLWWLGLPGNKFVLLASCSFAPLFYFLLRAYVPDELKRLVLVVCVYLVPLVFIGNLYEPRIFGEVLVLTYLLVFVGAYNYIGYMPTNSSLLRKPYFTHPLIDMVEKLYIFILLGLGSGAYLALQLYGDAYFVKPS